MDLPRRNFTNTNSLIMKATRPGSKPRQPIPNDPGFADLETARRKAIRMSTTEKGYWYIIEAADRFFVQDTCNLQSWDKLIATYLKGNIV